VKLYPFRAPSFRFFWRKGGKPRKPKGRIHAVRDLGTGEQGATDHCRVILSEVGRLRAAHESKDLRLLLLLSCARSESNGSLLFYSLFPIP